jgi:hypothetical protein
MSYGNKEHVKHERTPPEKKTIRYYKPPKAGKNLSLI